MRKHLENLRAKHPAVRSQVALTAAFSVTAAVALMWIVALPLRFGDLSAGRTTDNTAAALEAASQVLSPQAQEVTNSFEALRYGLEVTQNPQSTEPGVNVTEVPTEEYPPAEYGI